MWTRTATEWWPGADAAAGVANLCMASQIVGRYTGCVVGYIGISGVGGGGSSTLTVCLSYLPRCYSKTSPLRPHITS